MRIDIATKITPAADIKKYVLQERRKQNGRELLGIVTH